MCLQSTCGQRVFYQFGMTGIPVYNVNNNCSTGSTGLNLARTMIQGGMANAVMVIGFEKMSPGSLSSKWDDREHPTGTTGMLNAKLRGYDPKAPGAAQIFGNAGREYMEKLALLTPSLASPLLNRHRYGATAEDFAKIAVINHEHSQRNPYSQFQDLYTLEQVMSSQSVHSPLTKLQCCPTSDGGAAAILVSESFLATRPELRSQAILIAGQCLATDNLSLFDRSSIGLVGYEMTQRAARTAMSQAGVRPQDATVVELHDCFSANEMVVLDAMGLAPHGKAHEMVRAGEITYGGRCVVNPSGGLISKGHPLGATGIAQCAELVWQLRGWANNRLVENSRFALQHNLGLGGAVVVTVYKRADGARNEKAEDEEIARQSGVGYNPAVVAKGFTREMAEKVRSRSSKSEWALQQTAEKVQARF